MSWSAKQYSMFEQQRTRPVRDLVAAIPLTTARSAVDLGCGPGNSTEVLVERFPEATVTGLDSSEDMLRDARQRLPGVAFEQSDIGAWHPTHTYDVILANASLQWVPDHAQLYPRLVSALNPGGVLAVQTPDNIEEPAHRLAREIAASPEWFGRIGDVKHPDRHPAPYDFQLLRAHCAAVDVWRTTYHHPLAGGHAAVVEWFKGSALGPYLQRLDEEARQSFLDAYLHAISEAYPVLDDGTVLLPFPRLFVVATR
jgi:trans-aconitate 2-methyltransferase